MSKKLHVANLGDTAREAMLRDAFSPYGTVLVASAIMDKSTGQPKGYAFVEFQRDADADRAMEALNGSTLAGRVITVSVAHGRRTGRQSQ